MEIDFPHGKENEIEKQKKMKQTQRRQFWLGQFGLHFISNGSDQKTS